MIYRIAKTHHLANRVLLLIRRIIDNFTHANTAPVLRQSRKNEWHSVVGEARVNAIIKAGRLAFFARRL